MGIKFLCPNGHKLHVKTFLSGKRAICPKCGVRVVVPAEDQAGAIAESDSALRKVGALELATDSHLEASLVDDALEAMAASESISQPAAAPHAAADPFAEAPDAVWYVRAPTGGQYGPASADIMRNWLNEGRIGGSSLVWRAPWPEWRSAELLFPHLRGESTTAPTVSAVNGTPPLPASLPLGHAVQGLAPSPPQVEASPSMAPLAHAARKRRRKNDVSLIASAALVAISLILVIVLVLVFRAQRGGSQETHEEPPAASEKTSEPLI